MLLRFLAFLLVVVVVAALVLLIARSRDLARARAVATSRGAVAGAAPDPRPPATPAARHTDAVAAAREELQHAEAAHARAVQAAEERLAAAGHDVPVAGLAGLRLGRLSLVADGREHELGKETRFAAELGGVVRLRVEGTGWCEQVELDESQAAEAERFVATGRDLVRSLAEARADQQRRVDAALQHLAAVRDDTDELDRARMTLEDLEGAGPLRRDLPPAPGEDEGDGGGGSEGAR